MNYIGISNNFHDAAISIISNEGDILFAGHSERYSKIKHDKNLCLELAIDANRYIIDDKTRIHYYERPMITMLRQLRAGQQVDWTTARKRIGSEILHAFKNPRISTHNHHLSHAAAGFQTSPFEHATVVVVDAIGEFETITIWNAWYDSGLARYKKIYSKTYPHSIGLFYSAMTKRVGLKPLDEEYILMGMSAYGKDKHKSEVYDRLIENIELIDFKENLHIGVPDDLLPNAEEMDIAATTQSLTEMMLTNVLRIARQLGKSSNLVYGGGVALNCLANRMLGEFFDKIWIMPNPGDAGSSLGAAAIGYGKRLNWKDAFLGHDIPGEYPANKILDELLNNQIAGVASGRAEFGPRALGNRSLFADPRGNGIKDRVNDIKRRQKFRPFAPVIMEEVVHHYFDMPNNWDNSRYMQVVAKCRRPDLFPAIVHHDGTSRVQTVPKGNQGIRQLLEKWFVMTECPMLLNTSLNIRGEPIVNDRNDANRFEKLYGVKVLS